MSRNSSITTRSEFLAVGAIARRCAQGCLANLSGGIETVISRGFGLNQVASMNMAPYVTPPMTPINMRNRNRLGMVNPLAGQFLTKQWRNWDGRPVPRRRGGRPGRRLTTALPRRLCYQGA